MKQILTLLMLLALQFSLFANNGIGNGEASEREKAYRHTSEFISNQRFVDLSSIGFSKNEAAANKRLKVKRWVTFSDVISAPPVNGFEKLTDPELSADRAESVLEEVTTKRKFLRTFKDNQKIDLPFGIAKTVGQKEYVIAVDSIVVTPLYAYAVVYSVLKDVASGESFAFGAKIALSRDGGFAVEGGKLFLLSNKSIRFGQASTIELLGGNDQTFVDFDCNGYVGVGANLKITLLSDVLEQDQSPGQDVSFTTHTYFTNFDQWVISLDNLPDFQFKGLDDFTFSANSLVLDRSSAANSQNFTFPVGYDLGSDPNTWEGFCLQGLSVTLPTQFKKRNSDKRITFSIANAIIDKQGFTGTIAGSNLITLDEGDMNGWSFSLDQLSIAINRNNFNALGFEGQIVLPVNKEDRPFNYSALIEKGPTTSYFFSVATSETLELPLWGASNVLLYKDSRLEVQVKDKVFVPEAILSGKMDISASLTKNSDAQSDNQDAGGGSLPEIGGVKVSATAYQLQGALHILRPE